MGRPTRISGPGGEVGNALVRHPGVDKIAFTGSTEVGRSLIRGAAQTCTELSLELGGNAPVIVFDDADLDQAVEGILITKFRNNGQSCIAANRIYIQEGIYDRLVAVLSEKIKELKVGDGLGHGRQFVVLGRRRVPGPRRNGRSDPTAPCPA